MKTKEEIYQELLRRTGLKDSQVIEAYIYGSRVYGNARKDSDWDFIVVLNDEDYKEEQFSDNLINVNFFQFRSHHQRLEQCEPSAMECSFLDEKHILKRQYPIYYQMLKVDLSSLRSAFSAKSSNSWVKAKKKLTVPADFNDQVGKKSLWHAMRIIDFGTQIATKGRIEDYGSCNWFYDEVMFCKDWTEMFEKYKKRYNEMCTEFRKHAPKEESKKDPYVL